MQLVAAGCSLPRGVGAPRPPPAELHALKLRCPRALPRLPLSVAHSCFLTSSQLAAPLLHTPTHTHTQVCEDCPNVKFVREPEVLSVSVEPGMPEGHTITLFEEGEPILDGELQLACCLQRGCLWVLGAGVVGGVLL